MTDENVDILPPARTPWNEGKTLAAWVTTWLVVAGSALVALGFVLPNRALLVGGAVVVLGGLVLGRVLAILGHGKGGAATAKRDLKVLADGRHHQ